MTYQADAYAAPVHAVEITDVDEDKRKRVSLTIAICSVCIAVLVIALKYSIFVKVDDIQYGSENSDITTYSGGFTFYRSGYEPLKYFANTTSIPKYSLLDEYDAVIEPYAYMYLTVDYYDSMSTYMEFTLCDISTGESCHTGYLSKNQMKKSKGVKISCNPYDKFTITIQEKFILNDNNNTMELKSYEGKAICLYVRREIRDLTESDLQKTMDAMYTLWNTTEREGKSLYGSNFQGAKYCK
jgi:hypothetical protein